jgi:hypothetical protein
MIIRTRSRFPLRGEATVTATATVAGVRHTERGPAGAGYPDHERVARALAARLGLATFHDACGITPHGYRFTTTKETTP